MSPELYAQEYLCSFERGVSGAVFGNCLAELKKNNQITHVAYEPGLSLDDLRLQESEVQGARWYPIEQLEQDLMSDNSATLHAPQPAALYALGIAGMRSIVSA